MSDSDDDQPSQDVEITSLIKQFGEGGTCYTDSRVVDMLDAEHVDCDGLLELLRQIQKDYNKDQADCKYNLLGSMNSYVNWPIA